ncbi:helix-turn-helix domain-containing protein [Candidatus Thiodubiliella endoseptemdiera]|uniref:Helix-turn-helix transcriptional regulator n=1 Tax=Candidatus Thiodubiliella endoseptemdiera TaxID=2738886 RepID=A0A853EZM6_9GAMM|nr:helix-turn-helix transcriptional regulator [Candidatus Thiodubiliella endoseptemdiera]
MENTTLIGGKFITIDQALRTFGEQLKHIRKQQKTTQAELSEHCNVSLTVVKRLESGKPVSSINLMKILTSLGKLNLLIDLYKKPDTSPAETWKATNS